MPQVLGFAIENGNLTETDNNTTATFRGTGLGIARLVAGAPQFPYCAIFDYQCDSGFKRILNDTSFSASFNTSQNSRTSTGTPPTSNASIFSGNANENDFKRVLAQAVEELIEIAKRQDSNFSSNAENLLKNLGGYLGARDKALDTVVNRITYSIEYDNNRPSNQPSQSVVKFIVSGRPSSSKKSLVTFNSSPSSALLEVVEMTSLLSH